MGFNLENYEPVRRRKKRFFKDYTDGRITVELIKSTEVETVIKASLYRDKEDQKEILPLSSGHAQEFKGQGGMANKYAWLENCEESAIGRALDNAGYASDEKCSREEMIKVAEKEKQAVEFAKTEEKLFNDICLFLKELKEKDSSLFEGIKKTHNISTPALIKAKSSVIKNKIKDDLIQALTHIKKEGGENENFK